MELGANLWITSGVVAEFVCDKIADALTLADIREVQNDVPRGWLVGSFELKLWVDAIVYDKKPSGIPPNSLVASACACSKV